jgi:hypothetical protein
MGRGRVTRRERLIGILRLCNIEHLGLFLPHDIVANAIEAALGPEPRAEDVARMFHEEYERLAPEYGYETRRESSVPWEDVPAQNKALMIATAAAVLSRIEADHD